MKQKYYPPIKRLNCKICKHRLTRDKKNPDHWYCKHCTAIIQTNQIHFNDQTQHLIAFYRDLKHLI